MTLLQTVQGDRNPAALLLPATPRAMLDLQQDDAQGYLDGLLLSALLVGGRATVRRVQGRRPHPARLSARAVAAICRTSAQMVGRGSAGPSGVPCRRAFATSGAMSRMELWG